MTINILPMKFVTTITFALRAFAVQVSAYQRFYFIVMRSINILSARGYRRSCRAVPLSSVRIFTNSSHHFHSGKCKLRAVVRFQFLAAARTKMAVIWVVAPCTLTDFGQRFRSVCCPHYQGDDDLGSKHTDNPWTDKRCHKENSQSNIFVNKLNRC